MQPVQTVEDGHVRFSGDIIPLAFSRRVFSMSDALFMVYNTLNTIVALAQVSASFNFEGYTTDTVDVEWTTYTCQYGNVASVVIDCPYAGSPAFQAIIIIWVLYFMVLLTSKYVYSFSYNTNDLRFYISLDKFNSTYLNKVLVLIGILLTVISGLVALSFCVKHNNSSGSSSAILFIVVNAMSLYSLTSCGFEVLDKKLTMQDFEPIKIQNPEKSISNLYGLFIPTAELYENCKYSMLKSLQTKDDQYLSEIGNPEQLKRAMGKLVPL